jgi:DNA-binding transcriptional LysR family regulator
MDVDPRRLVVFLAVVRAGGVVGASRALHLTPQAVSQQIATLEDELGVPPFDRTCRRGGAVTPGAAGRRGAAAVAAGCTRRAARGAWAPSA